MSILTLDEVALKLPKVDLVKIDAEGAEIGIVTGMQQLIARDKPVIVLEFNAARYPDPQGFLDILLAAYGGAQELTLDGALQPLDIASVTNQTTRQDRLLVFG